jgi:hypothetical protein
MTEWHIRKDPLPDTSDEITVTASPDAQFSLGPGASLFIDEPKSGEKVQWRLKLLNTGDSFDRSWTRIGRYIDERTRQVCHAFIKAADEPVSKPLVRDDGPVYPPGYIPWEGEVSKPPARDDGPIYLPGYIPWEEK